MQVIQHFDPTGEAIVARVPGDGTMAIQPGSQLVVEEGQRAVFLSDGRALDTFGPGRHTLRTANLPLLTRLLGLPSEGKSPFQAALVFVSRQELLDLRWGTREPVIYRDGELDRVRLRAFGKFAVRVVEARTLVDRLLGTRELYSTGELEAYFRGVIVERLTDTLGETLQSVLDLAERYDELATELRRRVAGDFAKCGIELLDLWLGAVTPPAEVARRIEERSGMAAVGNLDDYLKHEVAGAMGDAARSGGGAAGGGVGLGAGAAMGMALPRRVREAMEERGEESAERASPDRGEAGSVAEAAAPAFCHDCGGKLPSGARFCPSCGIAVGE